VTLSPRSRPSSSPVKHTLFPRRSLLLVARAAGLRSVRRRQENIERGPMEPEHVTDRLQVPPFLSGYTSVHSGLGRQACEVRAMRVEGRRYGHAPGFAVVARSSASTRVSRRSCSARSTSASTRLPGRCGLRSPGICSTSGRDRSVPQPSSPRRHHDRRAGRSASFLRAIPVQGPPRSRTLDPPTSCADERWACWMSAASRYAVARASPSAVCSSVFKQGSRLARSNSELSTRRVRSSAWARASVH